MNTAYAKGAKYEFVYRVLRFLWARWYDDMIR